MTYVTIGGKNVEIGGVAITIGGAPLRPINIPQAPIVSDASSGSVYTTKDGDTLSNIIFTHYGHLNGEIMETVLEANRHITYTAVYDAGVKINLPIITELTSQQPSLKLWDVVTR